MTAYLAYSYSTGLTQQEENQINKRTKKARKEFKKGFVKGASVSLAVYSLVSFVTSSAHAVDPAKPPTDTAVVCPEPPAPAPPNAKPGLKPLADAPKGAFIGGSSAICGAALQSGDFALGVACAFLLVIGAIVVNRPPQP